MYQASVIGRGNDFSLNFFFHVFQITWIDGHGNVLTENIDYIVEPLSDNRRFTAKSVLKLMPRKHHHNTTFTCQAQNAADRTYRSAKLKLQVKYAPKVRALTCAFLRIRRRSREGGGGGGPFLLRNRRTRSHDSNTRLFLQVDVKILTGIGPSGRISEGADVTLLCEADANPSEMTYKWYVNNELVEGEPTTELVIRNVTRKLHDAMVKCKVHNSVGESEAFETLEVSCKYLNTDTTVCCVSNIPKWFLHNLRATVRHAKLPPFCCTAACYWYYFKIMYVH